MERIDSVLAAGIAHHRAGRLAEAEIAYRAVLDRDPDEVNALHLLGLVVRHAGKQAESLALIHRALQLNPHFVDARVNLANILRAAGHTAAAAVQSRRILTLDPGRADSWFDLGSGLRAQSPADLDAAVRCLRRAVVIRADTLPAHMSLGNGLLDRGDWNAALGRLRRALTLDPASPECWYNAGNAGHAAGDPADALRSYRRAQRLGLGLARTRVADVLTDLGRVEEARAVLLDSLPLPGTDVPTAIETLTGLMIRTGRQAEARALFSRLAGTPLAGVRYPGECLTALAALDLHDDAPGAAAERLAPVRGDNGWFFTVKSLAALGATLAERGLRRTRPVPAAAPAARRITSSTLAGKGRFAHTVLEYILVRLAAERLGCVLETPDWVGGAFFDLDDPPQGDPLPPLLFGRRLLNEVATGQALPPRHAVPAGRDILSPLFLFDHREEFRQRVQSWLRPRPQWAPWLDPAVERLRAAGSTVVAIHIRRGDFVTHNYPITDTGCYVDWLRGLWPRLDRPVLYLASDDLAAVRPAFADFPTLVRADIAPDWPGLEFLQDFHVLTQADVVGTSAASGFSQLAARLNRRARLFVEPDVAGRRIRTFQPWTP